MFKIGDKVRHYKQTDFGIGTVTEIICDVNGNLFYKILWESKLRSNHRERFLVKTNNHPYTEIFK